MKIRFQGTNREKVKHSLGLGAVNNFLANSMTYYQYKMVYFDTLNLNHFVFYGSQLYQLF